MKWLAIGLGVSILAVAVGAYALTARGVGQGVRDNVTPTVTVPPGAKSPTATPPAAAVDDQAGDREGADGNDDQAGDDEGGDGNDDQAGDGRSGGA